MKIQIDMNHPGHVHLFRNFIKEMEKDGHKFLITSRDKECSIDLLKEYDIKFYDRKGYDGLIGKGLGILAIDAFLLKHAIRFKPDIFFGGVGNLYVAQVAKLMRKPSIIFDDTEHARYQLGLMKPFATKIVTPESYFDDIGKKQIKYRGFHELAYLHPKRFRPNPDVKKIIGLMPKEKLFVIRFVSWAASHDIGQKGISREAKIEIVEYLSKKGKVVINSEQNLPSEFRKYVVDLPASKFHDLLAYSDLCITEGATVASECAVLGVPSVYVNSLSLGYIDMLEKKYGLIQSILDSRALVKYIKRFDVNTKKMKSWDTKHKKMLNENIDVTDFMVKLALKYGK